MNVFPRGVAALSLGLVLACGSSTPAPTNGVEPARSSDTPTRIFADGDVVAYTVKTADGRIVGRTHSTYRDSKDGLAQVQTRMALDPSVGTQNAGQAARSMEVVTTLNADLTPAAFKELSSVDGKTELRFKGTLVTTLTDNGVRDVPYTRDGAVLAPRHDLMVLALALDGAKLVPGSTAKVKLMSPRSPGQREELALRVYNDAEGQVVAQWSTGKVTLDRERRIVALEDAETGWRFTREVPPGDAPKIDPPADPSKYLRPASAEWSDREVSIDVRDGVLAGTLSEPRVRSSAGGALAPGVVFLSDLGAQDRSGFAGGVDWGTWQLLDLLADEGYAVLRLDDRSAGASSSKLAPEDVGLSVSVEDAAAAVAFMRAQPTVDPDRIFVIGHGLGGVTALVLASELDVAGVALVAAPFRTLPELMAANEAEETGADREKLARELRLAISALEGNQAARAQVGPQRLAELAAIRALFVEHGKLDLAKTVAKVKAEVAVFQGMKDFQVSWRDDAKPYADLLKKLGRKNAKLYVYENVDHLMKAEPGISSFRRYADKSRRLEPRFLDDIVGWLGERARAPR
ncbi:alpha/beta fold hydrolase [Myxococcota bacterium]|nr:alpha/beta fold hydrolase [Myxococcota bacterium]